MRYGSLTKQGGLAFIFGALVLLSGAIWISSSNAVSSNSDFKSQKQAYLLQISHLKQTLERSEQSFAHERKLASGLQRELRDAHDQINEMSSTLTALKKTKAQIEQNLQALSANECVVMVTRSATGATNNSSSDIGPPAKYEHIEAKISPYAPREMIVKAKPAPHSHSASDAKRQDRPVVATLTPSRRETTRRSRDTKTSMPSVRKNTSSRKTRSNIYHVSREKPRSVRSKAKPRSGVRAAAQKRRAHRATKSVKRSRKKQPSLFNKLARQGVFGQAYTFE